MTLARRPDQSLSSRLGELRDFPLQHRHPPPREPKHPGAIQETSRIRTEDQD